MSKSRISKLFSSDSKSLWNVSVAPGWTKPEIEVLRLALMKYGIGSWNQLVQMRILPGKTVSQIVCQAQRLVGQQSLKEFLRLHADVFVIGRENSKRTGVCRKNGIIINDGHNPTVEEIRKKREANFRKYGLSKEEIDRVVIPKLTEKQTSEVFDKRTNEQLQRDQLLSRLSVLRNALDYIKNGSPDGSISSKRRRVGNKRRRHYNYSDDELSDSTEEDMDLDFSNMPKRQSRRQRGLAPEYELTEMAANDF
ncbi:hypothetical protein WA588_000838 [Blastocystis sp. NMH]